MKGIKNCNDEEIIRMRNRNKVDIIFLFIKKGFLTVFFYEQQCNFEVILQSWTNNKPMTKLKRGQNGGHQNRISWTPINEKRVRKLFIFFTWHKLFPKIGTFLLKFLNTKYADDTVILPEIFTLIFCNIIYKIENNTN